MLAMAWDAEKLFQGPTHRTSRLFGQRTGRPCTSSPQLSTLFSEELLSRFSKEKQQNDKKSQKYYKAEEKSKVDFIFLTSFCLFYFFVKLSSLWWRTILKVTWRHCIPCHTLHCKTEWKLYQLLYGTPILLKYSIIWFCFDTACLCVCSQAPTACMSGAVLN